MVGRERELEEGRRFLGALAHGSACMVLEGEPGIGKTTVWRETVALAEQQGHRVLTCRPAAAEAKLSYAGLADLLAGVEGTVYERLPVPQRRALEVALLLTAPGQHAPQPRALITAFSTVLGVLAESSPLIVAIDDLQWLDRPSQGAVEFAVRRFGSRSIGCLVSVRVGGEATLPPALVRALEDAQAQRVALGPLNVAALHTLISARLGHSFARPVLVRIATASRGNPFYALEIAHELDRRGDLSPGDVLPVPEDLLELVSARIRRLPHKTQDVLLAAAALRDPVLELLDRAALDQAAEAGLVHVTGDRVLFAHPLFASAVYSSAGAERRRQLHQRLGTVLADPEERARHLALGADGFSEEIATALEAAAQQALSRGAPEGAAELLELAVRLTPPEHTERSRSREIKAAENHFHAGNRARARSLAEHVLSGLSTGPARGHALRILGEIRYHEDSFAEAIPLFEQALMELDDKRAQIDLHVNLAHALTSLGNLPAAGPHAEAAVELARTTDDRGLYAVALAVSAIVDFFLGHPLDRERINLALEYEDPDRQIVMPMRPSLIAGIALHLSDDFERAGKICAELRQRTIERGEASDLPLLSSTLSLIDRQRGNVDAALRFAEEGYEIGRTVGSQTAQALMLAERCFCRATIGDVQAARQDAEEVKSLLHHATYVLADVWVRAAQAFLEMSLGNAAAASDLLEPLAAAIELRGFLDPTSAMLLPDKIEALVALGELERAEALMDVLEKHGSAQARESALAAASRCRAEVLAARGDLVGALQAAERALEKSERLGMAVEVGRTLLVKGQIERRTKQKSAARESLGRALEIFDRVGARLWSERARAELARTGVRHSAADGLTPTELRVAELAARGLTMKRIAETLFLSPKTVESNLARIYQKLGIGSRAELGRVMGERERAAAK
jgi:DNA-binding CsgD family transcriptional regulator